MVVLFSQLKLLLFQKYLQFFIISKMGLLLDLLVDGAFDPSFEGLQSSFLLRHSQIFIGLFNLIDIVSIDEEKFPVVATQPNWIFGLEQRLDRFECIGNIFDGVFKLEAFKLMTKRVFVAEINVFFA